MLNRGLKFLDSNDELPVFGIEFPGQTLNPADPPSIELHLWNNKDASIEKTASGIEIKVLNYLKTTTGEDNYGGQEVIDDDLIEAKSDGIVGSGIVDDGQVAYTPIGAATSLSVGDIPINCARKIFFKLQSQVGTTTEEAIFFIQVSYKYNRVQTFTITVSVNEHRFFGNYFFGGVLF